MGGAMVLCGKDSPRLESSNMENVRAVKKRRIHCIFQRDALHLGPQERNTYATFQDSWRVLRYDDQFFVLLVW